MVGGSQLNRILGFISAATAFFKKGEKAPSQAAKAATHRAAQRKEGATHTESTPHAGKEKVEPTAGYAHTDSGLEVPKNVKNGLDAEALAKDNQELRHKLDAKNNRTPEQAAIDHRQTVIMDQADKGNFRPDDTLADRLLGWGPGSAWDKANGLSVPGKPLKTFFWGATAAFIASPVYDTYIDVDGHFTPGTALLDTVAQGFEFGKGNSESTVFSDLLVKTSGDRFDRAILEADTKKAIEEGNLKWDFKKNSGTTAGGRQINGKEELRAYLAQHPELIDKSVPSSLRASMKNPVQGQADAAATDAEFQEKKAELEAQQRALQAQEAVTATAQSGGGSFGNGPIKSLDLNY